MQDQGEYFTEAPPIPHSREAEEAAVGSVFINPDSYYDVASFLKSEDFYIHRLRWVWDAFNHLHETRTPIDLLTVSEELTRKSQIAEIGGPAYLTSLVNQVPTSLHIEAYGRIIEAHSLRRGLLKAASNVATLACDEEKTKDDLIGDSTSEIEKAVTRQAGGETVKIKSVLGRVFDKIDANSRIENIEEKNLGIKTGFVDIDKIMRGLKSTSFTVLGGRPGMGKSALALAIANNVSQKGKRVAIFSLEMSDEENVFRLLSQRTGIPNTRLIEGRLRDDEWSILHNEMGRLENEHIFMGEAAGLTPIQLKSRCKRLKMTHGIDLIIVDYLQLMKPDIKTSNKYEATSYISRELKAIARELEVPILVLAQLNRKLEMRENKRPMPSDFRDSGTIEEDADNIWFIYRDEYYKENSSVNLAELLIPKHRGGMVGVAELFFNKSTVSFSDVAKRKVDFA